MINTKLTRKAMIIAYNAHKNQFDKAQVPYIYHPIHLAEQMTTETECIVALLHDVVEDTDVTFEQLEKEFPFEIIEILKLLTHDNKEDYMTYIERASLSEDFRLLFATARVLLLGEKTDAPGKKRISAGRRRCGAWDNVQQEGIQAKYKST